MRVQQLFGWLKKRFKKVDILDNTQTYKLLKDLPNLKSGALLYYHPESNFYIHVKRSGQVVGYPPDVVEVYRKWFEPTDDIGGDAWWSRDS